MWKPLLEMKMGGKRRIHPPLNGLVFGGKNPKKLSFILLFVAFWCI
jgi:hypothetical protein